MTGTSLLSLQGITACYGNINALARCLASKFRPARSSRMIGANGAGKSTLMMTIFGNPRATRGRVVFDGQDITQMPTHEIARLGLALSPEGRRIFGRMTVEENLRMGAEFAGHHDYRRATWPASPPSSRVSKNACTSAAARCPAASNRCSPSPAR